MIFKLGYRYLISTHKQTLLNKKIEVVALLTFDEAIKRVPYDIATLAINEEIIPPDGQLEMNTYFSDKDFYHCKELDDAGNLTGNQLLLWDGVVDDTKTNVLSTEYRYNLNITIPLEGSTTRQNIITTILETVNSTYGTEYLSIAELGVGADADLNELYVLREKAALGEQVIGKLSKLYGINVILDKILNMDATTKITDIFTQIEIIQSAISKISANIY